MTIHYRPAEPGDYEQIRELLSRYGWRSRVADSARFRMMLERADRTIVALQDSRIVGFGRALCDGVSNGYLSMIVVEEESRGRGIGTEIVRRLMGDDPEITWVLRAGRQSSGFWERLGFRPSEIAMERTRANSDSAKRPPD